MMSFSWKQYEGQVINNTFPLERYLGGSSESAVFLTQLAGPQSSKAVLKLIPEGAWVDLQLSLWRRASKLTHPNFLQLYQGARCRLADMDLLYVVMEYAEENLSEILPQRALTPSEARDMLSPVVDALSNLHAQGLVHSHLKPSNILATSDHVKLSTDRVFPAGETRKSTSKPTPYDAPESANQALSAASDVWSLGVILIEVLTQRVPGGTSLPSVPESLPQPFREIAQHALERDPGLRWSVAHIAASLNPRAAAAAQSASALSLPVSRLQVPKSAAVMPPAPRRVPPAARAAKPAPPVPVMPPIVPPFAKGLSFEPLNVGGAKRDIVLPSYVVPLAVALLVVFSIIALPKILGRHADTSSASTSAASRASAPGPEAPRASAEVSRGAKPSSSARTTNSLKTAAAKSPAKDASQPVAASPSPASPRTETKTAADTSSRAAANSGPGHGAVLEQILPDIPDKALATITGKVRVTVLAHVDAAGNVSDAEFENPGPSKYFADSALKAVRRWEFSSPEVGGRSIPSEWLVRFEFSASGIQAFPTQSSP
ncbi:MAG TPA: TonB family protein [Candidatus Acidoferrum sp.]|jgi:TonB family protein|nr:TonB family protein [Candidatus Acidoferrum sp.]